MKKHILFVLIFYTAYANCQTPGYMGRKLSIAYSPAIGVGLQDWGNIKGDEVTPLTLNFRNDLDIEYCIGRGLSLVPSVKYGTSKMRYVSYYNFNDTTSEGFTGDIKLRSMAFGLKFKNYSFVTLGGIAPHGNYFSFEVLYEKSHVASSVFEDYYGTSDAYNIEVDFDTLNYEPAGQILLTLGGGKQEIYRDKWLLDIGWEIGMSLTFPPTKFSNEIYYFQNEQDFSNFANKHIAKTYLLNFSVGFGYLFPEFK
ncbi:MAG: hypothetical protein H7Y00_06915 [Fimbriimonadaceae bacterium]|nr:hypothetical protein [Chitinophagales bacterium]